MYSDMEMLLSGLGEPVHSGAPGRRALRKGRICVVGRDHRARRFPTLYRTLFSVTTPILRLYSPAGLW